MNPSCDWSAHLVFAKAKHVYYKKCAPWKQTNNELLDSGLNLKNNAV